MSRRSSSTTYGLSFWLSLPLAGLFCAAASVLVGLPILRLRGVYFAMVTLVLTEVARLSALALPITNGAKGITSIPSPGPISLFGLTIVPAFDTFAERNARLLFPVGHDDGRSASPALWRLVNSRIGQLFAALRQNEDLASSMGAQRAGAARARLRDLVVPRRRRRRDLRRHRPVDLSVELHRQRQRQLHAELLPRRPRLRVRPDARHARALFRLGPPVPDGRSISS